MARMHIDRDVLQKAIDFLAERPWKETNVIIQNIFKDVRLIEEAKVEAAPEAPPKTLESQDKEPKAPIKKERKNLKSVPTTATQ